MREYGEFLRVAAEWEAEFARNRERYGERIHCRKGCSDCCSQMFQITEIEAAFISAAVKSMPEKQRAVVRNRAQTYQEQRRQLLASRKAPDAWGALPPPGLRLPCPALADGACSIYDHRPMICRKYGIPLYNPQKPENIFACELNFAPGEEIVDTELVGIQTNLYNRWTEVQADYNQRGGRRDPQPLTVARAILEDFEPYLPRTCGESK
ncbi:MAG: YkgJ family cysteine cluster protein [Acidobacteriota bacterium]|nr:YkgJ family cysteine cluster protein [Acidobacteriota bacterium]